MVVEKEPRALDEIKPVLSDRRDIILTRIKAHETSLRETFAALETLAYRRSYDECVALVRRVLR
jgi:hypothetical protein